MNMSHYMCNKGDYDSVAIAHRQQSRTDLIAIHSINDEDGKDKEEKSSARG